MTKMKINPLPSITWHWLGMNDCEVDIDMPDAAPAFSLSNGNRQLRWISGVKPEEFGFAEPGGGISQRPCLQHLETGMGEEFTRAMENSASALLDIPAGYRDDEPAVINVSSESGRAAGRLSVNAGAGSETVVVISIGGGENSGLHPHTPAAVALQLELYAQAGARLKIFVVQTLPVNVSGFIDIGGVCGERAGIELNCLPLGSQKAWVGIAVNLKGDGSTFDGDMGYRVKSGGSVDINYVARHRGRETKSRMNAWGVLEEGSRKLFRGTIDFHEGCSGSVGSEKEDVLLLGSRQVNQTIPLILCHEEDVEGNHGATISRLDDEICFYLASRGVDSKAAENMIASARLEALINRIPDAYAREAAAAAAG